MGEVHPWLQKQEKRPDGAFHMLLYMQMQGKVQQRQCRIDQLGITAAAPCHALFDALQALKTVLKLLSINTLLASTTISKTMVLAAELQCDCF